jgi:multicomponent Na+:H+ antiporter subunit C
VNFLLVVTAGLLAATGTYLLLGRQLSRIVIGVGLLGHGVNILFVVGTGDGGTPAFVGGDPERFADPLPQALVLTAIVITFGVVAFLLALAFRSWQLRANDEVEDDIEDRRIARESTRLSAEADRI